MMVICTKIEHHNESNFIANNETVFYNITYNHGQKSWNDNKNNFTIVSVSHFLTIPVPIMSGFFHFSLSTNFKW